MSNLYESEYKITSPFGPRNLNGDTRTHKGIDTVGITNKYLVAVCDAVLKSSQIITNKNNPTWEWGNYIKLDDGFGYSLFYCHLLQRLVNAIGSKIKKGQRIGVEGQTGYSFGSHCHFEVRDSKGVSIDPQIYFKILKERENKNMTIDEAKKIVKEKAKLDDKTIDYMANDYKYGEALILKLAKAMD
jgi:murein DD-endopeptidase MepM/ murein hydrolase activator NlpD